ncbi:hypothetical protein GDO81_024113 [Engystomops pustulosus]|uniref:Cullin N-terminal domain-containing protein n=1 Tax=Engystomops pustulosus TaxID=76066 RepID=A0AAV6ZQ98_ENGPU|nr:hypothetical protein GDO81_024113 [Engystomops pustulosus]
MNVITVDDYKNTYWPKLDSAIDQLLTQSPGDYIPISYEQIYSCVYKCVCQQHSEQMYSDLMCKITAHLEKVSLELQATSPEHYIEKFNLALSQYMGALHSIVPLFIYMNKFYIETKLNRDLKDDLIQLFTEHVAEKHIYSLMPLLLEAQSTPFQITPSTMNGSSSHRRCSQSSSPIFCHQPWSRSCRIMRHRTRSCSRTSCRMDSIGATSPGKGQERSCPIMVRAADKAVLGCPVQLPLEDWSAEASVEPCGLFPSAGRSGCIYT